MFFFRKWFGKKQVDALKSLNLSNKKKLIKPNWSYIYTAAVEWSDYL